MVTDANGNNIPDTIDRITGLALTVAIAVIGAWGAIETSVWTVAVVAGLSYLSTIFRVGVLSWSAKWNTVAMGVLGASATILVALQAALPAAPWWLILFQAGVGAAASFFGVGLKSLSSPQAIPPVKG